MAVKLEPLADRLVVRPIEREEVTKGGIVLPDTAKEKPQEGKVLAVGPGRLSEDGKRIAMDVKVGDIVVYAKYGGTEIKIDDEELIIKEVLMYKYAGGKTIVDMSNLGLGRDPQALARISRATGLNIIMGSGYYTVDTHRGPEMKARSEDEIVDNIINF